jgi:hypothetical protein
MGFIALSLSYIIAEEAQSDNKRNKHERNLRRWLRHRSAKILKTTFYWHSFTQVFGAVSFNVPGFTSVVGLILLVTWSIVEVIDDLSDCVLLRKLVRNQVYYASYLPNSEKDQKKLISDIMEPEETGGKTDTAGNHDGTRVKRSRRDSSPLSLARKDTEADIAVTPPPPGNT